MSEGVIVLSNVTKTVQSGAERLTILREVGLTIPAGQFVAVVGPSGSGKSTLLGLIAGLDAPTEGRIQIDGEEITRMGEDALAALRGRKIGIVFQSFHLIPSMTALENVLAPLEIAARRDATARARQLLADVELTERAHHYPSQLSGGEQQRVAIARAFANDPAILLADEPTGNLDSRNGQHVFDLMLALNRRRGATLVLVTHEQELASRADRRIFLRDGQVVADETSSPSDPNANPHASESNTTGPSRGPDATERASDSDATALAEGPDATAAEESNANPSAEELEAARP
jgi:putative ABC transport system ATP-binding protein